MSTSALTENEEIYQSDGMTDSDFARRGCCSWLPRYGSSSRASPSSSCAFNWWERVPGTETKEPWWKRGGKKIREWSELVAGPKWKTFIRRFKKHRLFRSQAKPGTFQYDPLSYARNFDEGAAQTADLDNEDYFRRDFSMRYASIPASAKSSMDLGKEDPPFLEWF